MENPALPLILFSTFLRHNKTLVLPCTDSVAAEEVYRLCYNFWPEVTLYFPDDDADSDSVTGFGLRTDRFRSEVVNALKTDHRNLIISTASALREKVLAPIKKVHPGYFMRTGDQIDRDLLIRDLSAWGYSPEDVCLSPKTYTVRGGILDVFLLYSAYPLRIEFFGDVIDSMRLFNPLSQRKVKDVRLMEILPPPDGNSLSDPISFLERYPDLQQIKYERNSGTSATLMFQYLPDWKLRSLDRLSLSWLQTHRDAFQTMVSSRKVLIVFTETGDQIKALKPLLPKTSIFVIGSLDFSFDLPSAEILGLSAARLYNRDSTTKTRWDIESSHHQIQVSSISDLDWGDYLVHQDYGVGRYRGLETVTSKTSQQECIRIEYGNNGAVYVPVEKFNRVHKLIVSANAPPTLSTLGTNRWQQQKRRVKAVTATVVQEIINAYRSRQHPRGFTYDKNDELYDALVASFPYDETEDQRQAILAVMHDMDQPKPMDRLICGDVGFGKTEIALRASLRVVASGKKVLFLTPTTILADQHFISTKSRLEPLGIRVELLSRFRTLRQQKQILEKMLTGDLDLVIGTHRLLSPDVQFPDLGLLIIDEEHRFGVRHKEKLRQLKASVDVLILTATPIPRTLQQSLTGIRQISKIDTPPKARKPIQTSVSYFNWNLVEQHIKYELDRRGQVYFLHNDVLSLPFIAEKVQQLFPSARVSVAHGQMKSRDLERIVLSFFAGDVDVLICTTIIESGLDVANANTIIINEAHRFGLAQLYQIRGRVGRSYRQAYCYLFIPRGRVLGKQAYQRLKAIEHFTSLGSGYDIARKDLEIRGAGNLFGFKQSGHIATVGFDLYCKLLQEAVDEALGKKTNRQYPKIVFHGDAFLSVDTIPLVQDRLYFYQRLSSAESVSEIEDVHTELRDRFGSLSEPALRLLDLSRLRIRFTGTSISRIVLSSDFVTLDFTGITPFKSLEQLLSVTTKVLVSENVPYQFFPGKNDSLTLKLNSGSEKDSFRSVLLLAGLFSMKVTKKSSPKT
ncbi:MAG: DEAD/DEAH box helicase [FCB group bacterium]|nr:DEAD/DEAH box helicase [FCB group bacterium]